MFNNQLNASSISISSSAIARPKKIIPLIRISNEATNKNLVNVFFLFESKLFNFCTSS